MKKTILLLSMGLLLFSCGPQDNPDPDEVIISENAKIIDDQTWENNVLAIDSTNYTITFKEDITAVKELKTGDILVSTIGNGLLRKITNITTTKAGSDIVVETGYASLTDFVEQGSIEKSIPLSVDDIETIEFYSDTEDDGPNNVKGTTAHLIDRPFEKILYDNDGNRDTKEDQVSVNGKLTCDMNFILKIKIKSFSLVTAQSGIVTTEALDLALVAGLAKTLNKEMPVARVFFAPITIPIGPVAIIVTPRLDFILGVAGYVNGSVTCGFSQSFNVAAGMQYSKDGGWSSYNTPTFNFTFNEPQINTNAGISTYVKAELSTKIYNVAGPYVNGKAYYRLAADLQQTPWWELYGGFNINAGMNVKVLDFITIDYHKNGIIEYERLITHAPTKPSITTGEVTNITTTTATCSGTVTSDGKATVTTRGVCWSALQNPTIANSKTTNGDGQGTFTSYITGLYPNTTYYVRAYATNAQGTAYGEQRAFTTNQGEGGATFVDSRDGHVYKMVTLGEQVWMAENLAYLPSVSLPTSGSSSSPYYYVYDYNGTSYTEAKTTTNYQTYGVLYNWKAAMNGAASSGSNPSGVQGVCPEGWHLPSDAEWTQLETYLTNNGYKYDGSIGGSNVREKLAVALVANFGWESSTNEGAAGNTDYPEYRYKSGFSALPGGYRNYSGTFGVIGNYGYWWSSTQDSTNYAWFRYLNYSYSDVGRNFGHHKASGFSVRCLRD